MMRYLALGNRSLRGRVSSRKPARGRYLPPKLSLATIPHEKVPQVIKIVREKYLRSDIGCGFLRGSPINSEQLGALITQGPHKVISPPPPFSYTTGSYICSLFLSLSY